MAAAVVASLVVVVVASLVAVDIVGATEAEDVVTRHIKCVVEGASNVSSNLDYMN